MKRHYIILAISGSLLIIGGVIGLVWNKTVSPAPTVTAEQVISRIQVYGLPSLEMYGEYGPKNPVGQWAAIYEGDGQWRVRGAVVVQTGGGKEYYYSTIWIYQEDGQIELVDFSGSKPPAPLSPPLPGSGRENPFRD